MSSAQVPERSELLCSEVWQNDTRFIPLSALYIDVDGASPEITNHASGVSYSIIEGSGVIAVAGSSVVFEDKKSNDPQIGIYIPPRSPYSYSGRFSAIVRPDLLTRFITFGDSRLGVADRLSLLRLRIMLAKTSLESALDIEVADRSSQIMRTIRMLGTFDITDN